MLFSDVQTHWDCKPGKGETAYRTFIRISVEDCQRTCLDPDNRGCRAIDYMTKGLLIGTCRLFGRTHNFLEPGDRIGSKYCELESETKIKGNEF